MKVELYNGMKYLKCYEACIHNEKGSCKFIESSTSHYNYEGSNCVAFKKEEIKK